MKRHVLAGRVVRGALVGPLCLTTLVAVAVVALAGFASALLRSAVVPDPDLLLRLLAGALGAAGGVALPIGLVAGLTSGLDALRATGGWQALRASAIGGGDVARAVGAVAGAVALAWLVVAHGVEPYARAALRDAQVAAVARIHPQQGRTLRIGDWSVALDADGSLRFAGGPPDAPVVGVARGWSLVGAQGGVLARLSHGTLRGAGGSGIFDLLEVPVPVGGTARVHVSERATAALARAARTPYERWILWKRTLLPLSIVPLALLVVPLTLRTRAPAGLLAGALALSWWGLVRVLDAWVVAGGGAPMQAAIALLAALGAALAVTWSGWRDA